MLDPLLLRVVQSGQVLGNISELPRPEYTERLR